MRILSRRTKLLIFGFLMFFLGYFTVNFVQTGRYVDVMTHGKVDRPPPPPPPPPLLSPPGLEQLNQQLPLLLPPLQPETDLKQDEQLPQKSQDSNANDSTKTKTLADQSNVENGKTRYLAFDGGGFGSVNREIVRCQNGLEVEVTDSRDRWNQVDFFYFHMAAPKIRPSANGYVMVYTMESEVHSYGGESWLWADFRMWYNLNESYPEPATYFDVRVHLVDLLSPPRVSFSQKEASVPIVWVVSNCNAYNGREKYMRELMQHIDVDSYGMCLRNKFNHTSEHMKGNVDLFARYKFVIAIENSNCNDYVTEKLAHAVASGSIPIVAGRLNKPDYIKFMPKKSYINLYDFKSVEDLAQHLKKVASNQREYEKYIKFKFDHNYTREELLKKPLGELVEIAKKVLGYENERDFFDGLVAKEKSENKLCKLARYLHTTPKEQIANEIESNQMERPNATLACLGRFNLVHDFKLNSF